MSPFRQPKYLIQLYQNVNSVKTKSKLTDKQVSNPTILECKYVIVQYVDENLSCI